jgi:hypothetical protein
MNVYEPRMTMVGYAQYQSVHPPFLQYLKVFSVYGGPTIYKDLISTVHDIKSKAAQ